MTRKLKAGFGLALLAALVVSAMGAMSASAITSGHFTSDSVNGTKFDISETTGTAHATKLTAYGSTVECHNITYTAHHISTQTTQILTVTPTYHSCTSGGNTATVTMNGCHYEFTSRTPPSHGTPHFRCPAGVKAKVETSNGTMQFGAQTPTLGGVVYETATNAAGKHIITANITVEGIHGECHGLCQFLGTNTTTAKLTGSVTVEGTDTVTGAAVNITAT